MIVPSIYDCYFSSQVYMIVLTGLYDCLNLIIHSSIFFLQIWSSCDVCCPKMTWSFLCCFDFRYINGLYGRKHVFNCFSMRNLCFHLSPTTSIPIEYMFLRLVMQVSMLVLVASRRGAEQSVNGKKSFVMCLSIEILVHINYMFRR
jgi:hypothetical protein